MGAVVVTGASRGLGAAIARGLGAAGWDVAVNFLKHELEASSVAEDIIGCGSRALLAQFDVTDEDAVDKGMSSIVGHFGSIDVIVNNATGPQPLIDVEAQTWEDYLAQLHYFVKAPLLLLRHVLPEWRRRRFGKVINIGSECFGDGTPRFAHYVAAKGAMLGLTRSWARELGAHGICVNLVEPGWIPVERHMDSDPALLDSYQRQIPLQRLGRPADIVGIVLFLASPAAAFITGQAFAVNGGRTLS